MGDLEAAIPWYTEAANHGSDDAMVYLGYIYKLRGDMEEAIRWTKEALKAGNTLADGQLRGLRARDVDTPDLAIATRNLAEAQLLRGNLTEAERLWHVAADSGDTESMLKLGTIAHTRGILGVARMEFERAAAAGDATGATLAGDNAKNRGAFHDEVAWHLKAVELGGGAASMIHVAFAYERLENDGEALRWYHLAADAGSTDAMFNLGIAYRDLGDAETSLEWFQRAAVAGDVDGWVQISNHYLRVGDGPRQIEMLKKAAAGGHEKAIAVLRHEGISF